MPDLISTLGGKQFVPRLKQQVLGLVADFWADGPENLLGLADFVPKPAMRKPRPPSNLPTFAEQLQARAAETVVEEKEKLWHALPGEISEKMWGDGFVTPGGQIVDSLLVAPFGLFRDMSVLDLSAGLGGRMRDIVEESNVTITGLEPDPAIAERGMQMSLAKGEGKHAPIAHYDPAHLSLDRQYNCIIARETFYRVADRTGFFATLAKHAKPQAQAAFTDYIVNPENREHPAIVAWRKYEKGANPLGLLEMAEAWAKNGFKLTVNEDLTDLYKAEVAVGLKRLMEYLASGIHPDKDTGLAILRRIETWKYRLAAIDAGMKFYRFYGMKT